MPWFAKEIQINILGEIDDYLTDLIAPICDVETNVLSIRLIVSKSPRIY